MAAASEQIICVTTDAVPGRSVWAVLGTVWGTGVAVLEQPNLRARLSTAEQIESGEAARREAHASLRKRARAMGANAVIGIGMDSLAMTETSDGDTQFSRREYTIYGTAVVIEPAEAANGG